MKIKFAIIGYGFIGRRHVNTIQSYDDAKVVAVCDINEDRLDEVRKLEKGIQCYNNIDDMLANADIDAVIISSNNNTHKEMVIKAAKAGKNIICEKPAAMSVSDLDEMIQAVEEAKVLFTVHQQRRFDKDFRSVKEVYDKGILGDIYTIKSSLYGYNGNMHDWHVYKSEGGGMMYDWGVHLIDQILFMVDSKIKTVYADVRNVINEEVDDYFKIILRFENNVTAEIELGTYFLSDSKDWFERHWYVGGNKGSMYANKFDPEGKIVRTTRLLTNVAKDTKKSVVSYGPTRSFGVPEPGLIVTEDIPKANTEQINFFDNYFRAMKAEEEFLVKIPEVRRVLSVMEAAFESGRTGRSIDFE